MHTHTQSDDNPYSPPASSPAATRTTCAAFERGNKKGPALYIVGIGMLFGFAAVPLLIRYNPVGLAMPLIGCVCGGIVYRARSRKWPVDPTARKRQMIYAGTSLILVPTVVFMFTGIRAQGFGMVVIGTIVGFSVAVGILVSGVRRHGSLSPSGSTTNQHQHGNVG